MARSECCLKAYASESGFKKKGTLRRTLSQLLQFMYAETSLLVKASQAED